MKKFINLSKNESLEIFPEVIFNGKRLSEISKLAGKMGDFGIATSLSILSSEEFVKAFVLYIYGVGINIYEVKNIQDIFSKHKAKHEISAIIEVLNIVQKLVNREKLKPIRTPKSGRRESNVLKSLIGSAIEIHKTIGNINWWEKADNLKNQGLYVDYKDSLLLPRNISEANFITAYKNSTDLHKKISSIIDYIENLSIEKKKVLLNDIINGIKLFSSHHPR